MLDESVKMLYVESTVTWVWSEDCYRKGKCKSIVWEGEEEGKIVIVIYFIKLFSLLRPSLSFNWACVILQRAALGMMITQVRILVIIQCSNLTLMWRLVTLSSTWLNILTRNLFWPPPTHLGRHIMDMLWFSHLYFKDIGFYSNIRYKSFIYSLFSFSFFP